MIYSMLKMGERQKSHIFDLEGVDSLNFNEWKKLRSNMKIIWEKNLHRELSNVENQVWMFPRVCEVCRQAKQDILLDCTICHSASYCSMQHMKNYSPVHNLHCSSLKLSYEISLRTYYGLKQPEINLNIPENPKEFPENIETFLETFYNINDLHIRTLESEALSPFLTVLNALKTVKPIKEKLVIHFIGASLYEYTLDWKLCCSLFYKWISKLKELIIILIGPEMVEENYVYSFQGEAQVIMQESLYHDYVNSQSYVIPDVITAFNCGFHEFAHLPSDTWAKSIKVVTNMNNIMFLFTSYTEEEAMLDIQRVENLTDKQVSISCQKNLFGSLLPLRDWGTKNVPIFYNNQFISIIRK